MVTEEILNIIQAYVTVLRDRGVTVDKVILFGSQAAGTANPVSDIDLAVVSPGFGNNRYEEGKLLLQLAWRIDRRLQPIPLAFGALEEQDWVPLYHEIRTNGLEVQVA